MIDARKEKNNMVDIIIYTTEEKLLHKQGKLKDDPDYSSIGEYFWGLHNMPKKIDYGFKIYFATKGYIKGYFIVEDFDRYEIVFNCKTWKDIEPIKTKPFQGFKYADKVPELKR